MDHDNEVLIGTASRDVEEAMEESSEITRRKHGILTPNLFISFLPTCFFAVLVVSYWLTNSTGRGIPIETIFICEMIVLAISIIAMTVFILIDMIGKQRWRPIKPYIQSIQTKDRNDEMSCKLPLRECLFIFISLGSLALVICHIMSIIYRAVNHRMMSSDVVELATHCCHFVSDLMQLLFILHYNEYILNNKIHRYIVSLVISSDCCILIKYVFYFVRKRAEDDLVDYPFFPMPKRQRSGAFNKAMDEAETYFYFHIVEYCLFTFLYLMPMWTRTSIDSKRNETFLKQMVNSHDNETTHTQDSKPQTKKQKALRIFKKCINLVSYHSFFLSASVCFVIVIINLALSIIGGNQKTADGGFKKDAAKDFAEKVALPIEVCVTYISGAVAFIGYFLSAREQSLHNVKHSDKRMLLLTAGFFIILAMVETVESGMEVVNGTDDVGGLVEYAFFTFFRYVFVFCQTQLVIKVTEMRVVSPITFQQLVIRGICIYLAFFSFEKWIEASFLTPIDLLQTNHIKTGFGVTNWWSILSLLYPCVSFYLILCTVMFYEAILLFPRTYTGVLNSRQ